MARAIASAPAFSRHSWRMPPCDRCRGSGPAPAGIGLRHFLNKSRTGANISGGSRVYSGMQGEVMAHVSGLATTYQAP